MDAGIAVDNLGRCLRRPGSPPSAMHILDQSYVPGQHDKEPVIVDPSSGMPAHSLPTKFGNKVFGLSGYDFVVAFENTAADVR